MSNSCDPMGCSPPGPSVHGILQARILEWVAISFTYIRQCIKAKKLWPLIPVYICPVEPFIVTLTSPFLLSLLFAHTQPFFSCPWLETLEPSVYLFQVEGFLVLRLPSQKVIFPPQSASTPLVIAVILGWPVSSFTFSISCSRKTWMNFLVNPTLSVCVRMVWCILTSQK